MSGCGEKQTGGKPRGLECLTKAELYKRAVKKGIEGRSKMNKAQLIERLRSKKTK
jgi:hypothetical protein